MRPIVLASTRDNQTTTSLSAPIFESRGPHTRIYRAPVRAIGCLRFGDKEIYGQVMDVSPGGCLFKTESTIAVGTPVEMRVTIIAAQSRAVAEVQGVIKRVDDVDGKPSYGVEFTAASATERQSLQWLYAKAIQM